MVYTNEKSSFFLNREIDGVIKLKYAARSKNLTAFKNWPLRNGLWSVA